METLRSFHKLTLEERTQYLIGHGTLLCSRVFAGQKVFLYHAEIWFNTRKNKVSNILPFTTLSCLKPYLDLIEIEDAFV
jgi:hypothetical protein